MEVFGSEQEHPDEETALLPWRMNSSVEEFMAMYVKSFSLLVAAQPDTMLIGSCICKSSSLNYKICSNRRNMNLV
jgi:hypothetical protein